MKLKPNIILITTDQQRFDTINCLGYPHMHTPHFDQLCEQGQVFTEHFSQSPVCVPSRCSITTGQYPHQTGTLWNFSPFPKKTPSIFTLLKQSGYTTACIGKHHLVKINEQDHFDYALGHGGKWARGCQEFRDHLSKSGLTFEKFWENEEFGDNLGALESNRHDDHYIDGWLTEKSLSYLKNIKEPFCLWIGFYGPHHPYDPPKRFREIYFHKKLPKALKEKHEWENKGPLYRIYKNFSDHRFKQKRWPQISAEKIHKTRAHYYGEVSFIDEQIGKIIHQLEESKLIDHTHLILTSDHGDSLGDHDLIAKGPFVYDELIHVPMIIKTPESHPKTHHNLSQSIDIAPTILNWAGLNKKDTMHGLILNNDFPGHQQVIAQTVTQICYRTKQYKLIYSKSHKNHEVYDLYHDPHELNNIAVDNQDLVHQLKSEMIKHLDISIPDFQDCWKMKKSTDPLTQQEIEWEFTF